MTERSRPHCLAIIDTNRLRQASLASFLADWAQSHDLEMVEVSPEDILEAFDGTNSWCLIVVSIGSEPTGATALQMLFRILRAFAAEIPTVILSDSTDPVDIVSAHRAGCQGFIPTNMQPGLAVQALEFILNGGTYFPPSALGLIGQHSSSDVPEGGGNAPEIPRKEHLMSETPPENSTAEGQLMDSELCSTGDAAPDDPKCTSDVENVLLPGLTYRQRQVLHCLHKGQQNKVIARELGVTEGTVKVHVRQIMRRLGATNRTQAAVICAQDQSGENEVITTKLEPPNGRAHEHENATAKHRRRMA